ncbi:MAG: hypothetical protein JNN01_15715 [Opitutaceae bacterium]|nr:hypothetical protein [Opitutaceae bacterium]
MKPADLPDSLQRWARIRARGRLRYIVLRGMLLWGGTMTLVMTWIVNRTPGQSPTWRTWALSAALWLSAGVVYGWITWILMERKYQKHLCRLNPD